MNITRKMFQDLSFEEKFILITDYLNSIKPTDKTEVLVERMEWLRRHIPAYDCKDDSNYVFISYSHRDYKTVYNDLAFFSYNTRKKVRFWYDEGLPAGNDWFAEAEKRLSDPNCVGVIFYLSENLLRSTAVLKEIEFVKRLKKPYFTITLDNQKFCAADYLDETKDAELLTKVEPVFPRDDTSVSYGSNSSEIFEENSRVEAYDDEYENAFYRIQKIEQAFSVVEEVSSDFVCEEVSDGLSLVEYRGFETEIYIPPRIGVKKIVEIKASFNNATNIFIPETVRRILPVAIEGMKVEYDADDINTMSMAAIYDMWLGGIPAPAAPLGLAKNLVGVEVDPSNPVFCSKEGILYERSGKIVRFPSRLEWEDRFLEDVSVIGNGAFCGYENPGAAMTLSESVTDIEDNAFALSTINWITMENRVKKIGELAFAHCVFSEMVGVKMPLILSSGLESIGEFAFMYSDMGFISIPEGVKEIPMGAFLEFKGEHIFFDKDSALQLIHAGAFASCSEIEKIDLPKSVIAIDNHAFSNCEKLFCVTIPKTIRYLSNEAFDTENILKYILFEGNSRSYFYFRLANDIESADYLNLLVNKDQWFKRLKAKAELKRRERIKKKSEKLYEADPSKIGKRPFLWGITLPTVLYFILSLAFLFVADYRRLVVGIALDWQYWTICAAGFLLSFMSAKHVYWSIVVRKTKKSIAKNNNKPKSDFFDAWLNVAGIGLILFSIIAFIVTGMVSTIF
ncbi:MAG: leucine-rich repeat protein [Clostridia bacterium]|nr:leucine-rich repeat protein [Clostridia bacterium]